MRNCLFPSILIFCVIFADVASVCSAQQETATGVIEGKIGIRGIGPMKTGMVFFYNAESEPPPSATQYWKVPDHAFMISEDASFRVELPEGTYYMGAIQRRSGEDLGPPQDGDYFFIGQDRNGKLKKLVLWEHATISLGMIDEAELFSTSSLVKQGVTAIEGTIRDAEGKPVGGVAVLAFQRQTMLGRPLFVSARSDGNGRYFLRMHSGGRYYLRARTSYRGGPPGADELMGVYREGKPLTVRTKTVRKGIDITVTTIGPQK